MTSALVIGGGGWIGDRLCARLAGEGVALTALMLPQRESAIEPPGLVRIVRAKRTDRAALDAALADGVDMVFDLIAYTPQQIDPLIEIADGRIGRHVHLSSAAVYRRFPDSGRASEEQLERFDDDGPGYGPAKAACERRLERAVAERGFPAIILRAAPLIGAGDPCSRENWFAERLRAGRPVFHPGSPEGHLWLLPIDDLLTALVAAARAPDTAVGRSYHLALEDAPRLGEYVATLAQGLGLAAPDWRMIAPNSLREAGLALYGFPYAKTLNVLPDIGAAKTDLGWQPTTYADAIAGVIADLPETGSSGPSWPGRGTMQARLSATHPWLHADAERRLAEGKSPDIGDADSILGRLTGETVSGAPIALVASQDWAMFANASPNTVVAPCDLLARLGLSQTAASSSGAGKLVGVVEWDRWSADQAWLFVPPDEAEPHYALSDNPVRIEFRGYANRAVPAESGTRVLLETQDSADAAALADDLAGYVAAAECRMDDVARWASCFLVDIPRLSALSGAAAPWLRIPAIARLLQAAGISGAVRVAMGNEIGADRNDCRLPSSAALCTVGARWLVIDTATRRMIEVTEPIANVLAENLICARRAHSNLAHQKG